MALSTLSVAIIVLLSGLLQQVTPPAPNPGAAAAFPVDFDALFGAILSIGMKVGSGIGALVFLFMLVSAVKERPIRWSAVITEGIGIVTLVVILVQSNAIIGWIANLI